MSLDEQILLSDIHTTRWDLMKRVDEMRHTLLGEISWKSHSSQNVFDRGKHERGTGVRLDSALMRRGLDSLDEELDDAGNPLPRWCVKDVDKVWRYVAAVVALTVPVAVDRWF